MRLIVKSNNAPALDARVGDEITFTARARVVGEEEDVIDVTGLGGPAAVMPGEKTMTLYLLDVDFE